MPGYSKTPEHALIRKARLPGIEREQLRSAACDISNNGVMFGDDLKTIRWFHEQGIPQVIQTRRRMFEPIPYRRRFKVIPQSRPADR